MAMVMLRVMFYHTAMKFNSCKYNLWQQAVVQVPIQILLLLLPSESTNIFFKPSPLCPIFAFSLLMKVRLNFLCGWYYVSCFCLQIGWPSVSSSPPQQTADNTSHFLPSGRSLSHQGNGLAEAGKDRGAASMPWAHCIATVPQCRRHRWGMREVSANTAGSPISVGLWMSPNAQAPMATLADAEG